MEELFKKLSIKDNVVIEGNNLPETPKKIKKQLKKKVKLIIEDHENELEPIINKNQIEWINWSDKSKDISFKTTIKGVGDGEQKVANELDTNILGQNSDFDMKVIIEGIEYECDVKKLDNYTFNTGVKGRNALRPIKTKNINIEYDCYNSLYFSKSLPFLLRGKIGQLSMKTRLFCWSFSVLVQYI